MTDDGQHRFELPIVDDAQPGFPLLLIPGGSLSVWRDPAIAMRPSSARESGLGLPSCGAQPEL